MALAIHRGKHQSQHKVSTRMSAFLAAFLLAISSLGSMVGPFVQQAAAASSTKQIFSDDFTGYQTSDHSRSGWQSLTNTASSTDSTLCASGTCLVMPALTGYGSDAVLTLPMSTSSQTLTSFTFTYKISGSDTTLDVTQLKDIGSPSSSTSYTTGSGTKTIELDSDVKYIDFSGTASTGAHIGLDDVSVSAIVTNQPPTIMSNGGGIVATVPVVEGTTAVTTVTATDPDDLTLTYSIDGGADGAQFTIGSSTGKLAFVSAPDYENPTDSDNDNNYEVNVMVSDDSGDSDSQAITVTVTDADEEPPVIEAFEYALGNSAPYHTVTDGITLSGHVFFRVKITDTGSGVDETYPDGPIIFVSSGSTSKPVETVRNGSYFTGQIFTDSAVADTDSGSISVRAQDNAGNVIANGTPGSEFSIKIANHPPVISTMTPASGSDIRDDQQLVVSATITDNSAVNDTSLTLTSDNGNGKTYSLSGFTKSGDTFRLALDTTAGAIPSIKQILTDELGLQPGDTFSITISATDDDGFTTTQTADDLTYVIPDTTGPTVSNLSYNDGSSNKLLTAGTTIQSGNVTFTVNLNDPSGITQDPSQPYAPPFIVLSNSTANLERKLLAQSVDSLGNGSYSVTVDLAKIANQSGYGPWEITVTATDQLTNDTYSPAVAFTIAKATPSGGNNGNSSSTGTAHTSTDQSQAETTTARLGTNSETGDTTLGTSGTTDANNQPDTTDVDNSETKPTGNNQKDVADNGTSKDDSGFNYNWLWLLLLLIIPIGYAVVRKLGAGGK